MIGAGLLAALASTLCCITPLIFLLLGIGGAWVSTLTDLAPYRMYFLVFAIISVGAGFISAYKKPSPKDCIPGTICINPASNFINKLLLWIAVLIIGSVIIYPHIVPLILDTAKKSTRVEQRVVTLDIPKMFCPTCPFIIRKTLERIDGVISVKTSLETKSAVVTYDKNKVSVKTLIKATADSGYPSTERKNNP